MTKSLLSKAADVGHAYQLARLLDDAAVNDDFQSSCTKRALHCLRRAAPSGPLASRPPQSSARFKNCRARFSASHPVSAMPTIARSSTENDNRLTPGGARMYARSDGVLQPRPDGCPSLCPANGLAFSGGSVPVSGPAGQRPGRRPWATSGRPHCTQRPGKPFHRARTAGRLDANSLGVTQSDWQRVLPRSRPSRRLARAQTYPTRPVRWPVPVLPGDILDILARPRPR
jgi:hypothetical protein